MFVRPAFLLALAVAAPAQSGSGAVDRILKQLAGVRQFRQVAVAPDAGRLAWVEEAGGDSNVAAGNSAIYLLDLKSGDAAPRRVTAGLGDAACAEHSVAWSPASDAIAFVSNCADKTQPQIYLARDGGGPARRLTSVHGTLANPRWSPDGRQLAVLSIAAREPQPNARPGVVVRGEIDHQRLCTLDPASGRLRQVSPPGLFVYEYDWSPDGRQFVFTAAPGPGSDNWYIAQLYTLSLDTGAMRPILRFDSRIAGPRWSPDGKTVAFLSGNMSQGFPGGDVFTMPATGGAPVNRMGDRKSSAGWIHWLSPKKLFVTEHLDGGSAISTLDLESGRFDTLWQGQEWVHGGRGVPNFSLAADGRSCAVIRHSWEQPPEIWAGPAGRWRQVTHLNREQRPAWGRSTSIHWHNEGFQVQGWLLYPRDYSPDRRYPLVVCVHGGPAFVSKPAWPGPSFDVTALSGAGYFVFLPNPRGSYGQGRAFNRANIRDFGGADFRDILAGVDAVLKSASIDPNRIGITGWSYGGYISMWAATQTSRFRAAVAGAGIANWLSYYGQNDIDQWMIPFFGASVYDDPAVYAKSSPMEFIKRAKTPTLMLVGDSDTDCPAAQSYEFWHALRTLQVDTELVVYPGEGHFFLKPENRRDVLLRTAEWFDQRLK